jgi:hypothetical protein
MNKYILVSVKVLTRIYFRDSVTGKGVTKLSQVLMVHNPKMIRIDEPMMEKAVMIW